MAQSRKFFYFVFISDSYAMFFLIIATAGIEKMAITVDVSSDMEAMIIKFSGSFTFENWPEFRNKCLGRDYPSKIMLDFNDLTEINCAGLGMILLLRDKLPQSQKEMVLYACNEKIRKLLDCVEFERRLSGVQDSSQQLATAY